MKNQDYSFKLLVIVILAGVILACAPTSGAARGKSPAYAATPTADAAAHQLKARS